MEELSYKNFLAKHESKYTVCVMVKLEVPKWKTLEMMFEEEDLVDGIDYCPTGFETEPHITLHYGFNNDMTKDELEKWLNEWFEHFNSFQYTTRAIDLFQNEKYDVVKFNMEHLRKFLLPPLKSLKKLVDHVDNFPEYNPHMTIAYVKSGCGVKYADDLPAPFKVKFKGIKVSGGNFENYEREYEPEE